MKKILLAVLIAFFIYPTFPGFAQHSTAPDCTVIIEGTEDNFVVTTGCGKRIQYLMKKGQYKMWRYEGETQWKAIPSKPKITIRSEDVA